MIAADLPVLLSIAVIYNKLINHGNFIALTLYKYGFILLVGKYCVALKKIIQYR